MRCRAAVLAHPQYHAARRHIIDFLEHHAHQSKPSVLDDVIRRAGPPGAPTQFET